MLPTNRHFVNSTIYFVEIDFDFVMVIGGGVICASNRRHDTLPTAGRL